MNIKQAALGIQWGAKDFQLRPCCPLCRALETEGHKPDCVIGLALKTEPLKAPICHKCHGNSETHAAFCPEFRPLNNGDGLIYEQASKRADPQGHASTVAQSMVMLDEAILARPPRSWRQHAGLPEHYPLTGPTHVEKAMEACIAELGLVLGATHRKAMQYKREADALHKQLADVEARIKSNPNAPRYTCKGKGGEYELIGIAYGAGESRGTLVNLYKEVGTGVRYFRTPRDFDERMEKL